MEFARLALTLGACALVGCRGERRREPLPLPGEQGPRLTVEVLNASGSPGAARIATRALREAGIDVVAFGNAPADERRLDSTRILVRRGDRSVATPVRAALGAGRVVVQLDSSRLVDASVLVGADYSPRVDFHP
ncbi:MAG TPA: LytR C-terminal domain-containing protein [Gemmatimonadales bacterium]|nr:LytR C-terminal domain-containing protein [Gemmatimonadales bacterium]